MSPTDRNSQRPDDPGQPGRSEFVPPASYTLDVAYRGAPQDYYFLLLPNTTMLAFSAAAETLRVANQVAAQELYRWFMVTTDGAPVRCSNRIEIRPDVALQDVPGSAFLFICSGVRVQDAYGPELVNWLRRHAAHGGGVGSLCAGVFALAEAGLIRDRAFTLHWENQPGFLERFPFLSPSQRRYEADGGLLSCGGGNAAMDMMLDVVERDHGKELALYVSDMCIYARTPHRDAPQKTAVSAALGSRNPALISALTHMQQNLEGDLDLGALARAARISHRQLERLFKRYLGQSPMQYLTDLRLSRAHALLNETDLVIPEIAAATGFSGTAQLAKKFKAKYGITPHAYQRGWAGAG
ncbi:GlxA family transcriptional regulator [Aliiroseovarius sp.]|uniref:GlxA family transcriptional regulator n=1 Tax=Aliiroseovarius sp. TaxID=1872442 RepID=UPI0026182C8E|nr:GlxA family transcriptional regulator [Aliiroseovarius sp.]